MKKAALLLTVIILLAGGSYYGIRIYNNEKKQETENLFWRGRKALEGGDDITAFNLLSEAVKISPENAEFNLWAGIAARNTGKTREAYTLFNNSWDAGKREPIVFLNMIRTSSLPDKDKIIYFETLAGKLTEERSRLELSALMKYQRRNLEEAAILLKDLVTKYPEGIYAEFYAQILLELKQPREALRMLEKVRKAGGLNSASSIILSNLYFAIDNTAEAEKLLKETIASGLATPEYTVDYGRTCFFYGNAAKARKVLYPVRFPRMFTISDIASAEILIKDLEKDTDLAGIIIENSPEGFSDLLTNPDTLTDRFLRQRFLEQTCTTLNILCLRPDMFTDSATQQNPDNQLQSKLFIQNAERLAKAFPDSLKTPDYIRTTSDARIILLLLAGADNDNEEITALTQLSAGSRRWLEGERYLADFLIESNKNPDSPDADELYSIAQELLENNEIIDVTTADRLLNDGDSDSALLMLDRLTTSSIILARSPVIQLLESQALLASGELEKGEGILINLLKRGFITREVLDGLSRISLILQDPETVRLTLEALAPHTENDPELFLLSSSILAENGNIAAAEAELDRLLSSSASIELKDRALISKARLAKSQNDNQRALQILSKVIRPDAAAVVLQAEILFEAGEPAQALNLIESLKPVPAETRPLYASILGRLGRLDKAQSVLESIISDDPRDAEALRNLALVLHKSNQDAAALDAAKRAVDAAPDSINASILLAQLMLINGRPADAANLAEKVLSLSPDDPTALQLLTTASNAARDYPRAIQSADRALLRLPDNPYIIIQKASALVELSKVLDNESSQTDPSPAGESAKTATADLEDEIASLTSDIVYTGVKDDFAQATSTTDYTDTMLGFLDGRTVSDLRAEAERLLISLPDEQAARVLLLQTRLLMHKDNEVATALKNQKFSANELFSFGVITDDMEKWPLSLIAYKKAYQLMPNNPIILNNYANAVVMAEEDVDNDTRQLLLNMANDLPKLLKGDPKAINTSAMVYNYFAKYPGIIELAQQYPQDFKTDPRLKNFLNKAKASMESAPPATDKTKPDQSDPSKGNSSKPEDTASDNNQE